MKSKIVRPILLFISFFLLSPLIRAEGISVDAGLTPGQDRVIVRLMYRNITNKMGDNSMVMHMMPVVVAYGLSSDITLMMRNGYGIAGSNETMMSMENAWMDPFVMGKIKLFRKNTKKYVFGLAGFVGSSFPVFNSSLSKTYSPKIGVNASFRPRYWSFDMNNALELVNYNVAEKQYESRQLQTNLAISRNFVLRNMKNIVLAPVQEFSLIHSKPSSGENKLFGFVSPGFQLVSQHVKFEGLYQIPVNKSGISGLKNGRRLILGIRLMF